MIKFKTVSPLTIRFSAVGHLVENAVKNKRRKHRADEHSGASEQRELPDRDTHDVEVRRIG